MKAALVADELLAIATAAGPLGWLRCLVGLARHLLRCLARGRAC